MNTGTYTEKLPCGGELVVAAKAWEISYYFPGPDLRHNGTFVKVSGASASSYIQAFQENFEEFLKLKDTIPAGGEFSKVGKMGMHIRIGGYWPGVSIESYHMPIATPAHLKKVTDGYQYAEKRAAQVQAMLTAL